MFFSPPRNKSEGKHNVSAPRGLISIYFSKTTIPPASAPQAEERGAEVQPAHPAGGQLAIPARLLFKIDTPGGGGGSPRNPPSSRAPPNPHGWVSAGPALPQWALKEAGCPDCTTSTLSGTTTGHLFFHLHIHFHFAIFNSPFCSFHPFENLRVGHFSHSRRPFSGWPSLPLPKNGHRQHYFSDVLSPFI